MSELWICREEVAKKPFRLEMAGVEIRTIEELCFYLYQNIEHLDEDVMDASLFTWLSEELQLSTMVATLRQEQGQGRDVLWCAWFLLKEIGMYSDSELEEIRSICFAMENRDEFECEKLKADRLLLNKKYLRSIREYQRLIGLGEEKHIYPALVGDIWHNLGVAHARLFLFSEAAECFLKAYKKNLQKESLLAYENALRMAEDADQEGIITEFGDITPDQLSEVKEEYLKSVM